MAHGFTRCVSCTTKNGSHALILDDLQPLQLGLGQSEEAKAVINYRQNEGLIQYEQDPLMHICTGYDF